MRLQERLHKQNIGTLSKTAPQGQTMMEDVKELILKLCKAWSNLHERVQQKKVIELDVKKVNITDRQEVILDGPEK